MSKWGTCPVCGMKAHVEYIHKLERSLTAAEERGQKLHEELMDAESTYAASLKELRATNRMLINELAVAQDKLAGKDSPHGA